VTTTRDLFRARNGFRIAAAGVLGLGVSAAVLAQGGPPFVTDDPGTPGDRRWEINVAFVAEKRGGEQRLATPLVDANYGWGDRIQLKLEVPWVVQSTREEPVRNGLGNALLGVKWRFADEEKSGIAVAFYPQVEINLVSSSASRGLAERRTSLLLPLAFEKNLGPFSANMEIGHQFREGEKGLWFGGLALGRGLSDRLEVLAEVFGLASARFAGVEFSGNIGGRWKVGRRLVLLVSVGTGIRGSPDQPRAGLLTYAGIQLLLGGP
jgi:hypothetical protein